MDLTVILTLGVAAAGVAFTAWQGYEAHRQRRLSEAAQTDKSQLPQKQPAAPAAPSEWLCGIYEYPPLSVAPGAFHASAGGVLVDLATEVLGRLNQPFRFVHFNYDGFYENEDRIPDAIIGMFETRRRGQRMRFSRPIYEIGLQGICRRELHGDIFEGLRCGDLRLAVYSGEVGWEFLVDELPDAFEEKRAAIVAGGRQRDTMTLLESGSYDVVLMDEVSCLNFLRERDNANRFKLAFPSPPKTFGTCIAVKNMHADRLGEIDEMLGHVRNAPWFLDRESEALRGFENVVHRRGLKRRP